MTKVLPVIVLSQFLCTSLWFATNGVMAGLDASFQLDSSAMGHLTSAVQFGFIFGTLIYALLTIADRFPPSRVFFISAVLAAVFNLGTLYHENSLTTLLVFRFFTGFFLAGIYPVGMKIAADYFDKGLGKSLGYLVGALVLGTGFPHLINSFSFLPDWRVVIYTTSALALFGGLMMWLLVGNGPYRKPGMQVNFSGISGIFAKPEFRSAAFGYFGHMWELYAFWAFVPVMLTAFNALNADQSLSVSLWSFAIISLGGLACVLGGYVSEKFGVRRTAFSALLLSGMCCFLSPFILTTNSEWLFLAFLFFWGMVVIADSPLFSTLVAQNANPEIKGTALTLVNCLGFAISIVSIQLVGFLSTSMDSRYVYLWLGLGPVIGLVALKQKRVPN